MAADPDAAEGRRPTVSVIMVCYNGADLLGESLASLRAQSFEDWELVFWDNGSTDGSANLAVAFDRRARVFGGPERLTLGSARGKAVERARGRFIAILDHDDLWRADKLERQVARLSEGDAGLCYSDCEVIDEAGKPLGRYSARTRPRHGRVRCDLLVENFIPSVTVMMTREAYERAGAFHPSLNLPADYDQWLRVAESSSVVFDAEPLASYRLRSGGLTSDLDHAYTQLDAFYERLAIEATDPVELRHIARGWAAHYWRWAVRGLAQGAGVRETLRRAGRGWFVAGGVTRAPLEALRFCADLARGLPVRVAMTRARRSRPAPTAAPDASGSGVAVR